MASKSKYACSICASGTSSAVKICKKHGLREVIESKGYGNGTDLITLILRQGIRAKVAAEGPKKQRTNPWASDLGKCPLRLYRAYRNVPETNPPSEESQIKFLRGHIAEEALAKLFILAGCELFEQVRGELPLGETYMTVKPDFLLYVPEAVAENVSIMAEELGLNIKLHGAALLEIKSTSSRSVASMIKNGQRGRQEHRWQGFSYAKALHDGLLEVGRLCPVCHATTPFMEGCRTCAGSGEVAEPFPKVESLFLVYVLEDPLYSEPPLVAFEIAYRSEKIADEIEKVYEVWLDAQRGFEPERPKNVSPKFFPCGGKNGEKYCPYFDLCYGAEEAS